MKDGLSLDSTMTNREARPHLVKSYKGVVAVALMHTYTDKNDYEGLQWARKRDIKLRHFTRSGPVLCILMGGYTNEDGIIWIW